MNTALKTLSTLVLTLTAAVALAQTTPDTVVKNVANDVLAALKADASLSSNPAKLATLLDAKVSPYFNFNRMAALAMGKNWRAATPEQQKVLAGEFKTLLIRTYSSALAGYKDKAIDVRAPRMAATDTEVTVKSSIASGASPIQIEYSMEKAGDTWKAYDVTVAGVSLVTNYRDEFGNAIRDVGIDGLIKQLQSKNK
jgi:phospholipid transport system substrate-binding protein